MAYTKAIQAFRVKPGMRMRYYDSANDQFKVGTVAKVEGWTSLRGRKYRIDYREPIPSDEVRITTLPLHADDTLGPGEFAFGGTVMVQVITDENFI